MGKSKWQPHLVNPRKTKVSDEHFEQLLAEVGEVLYKRLCQQVQAKENSTESALNELGKIQFKKAVSK